jgi:G:T-mismatch repair DNA endonuclease (very short patch repair protein)
MHCPFCKNRLNRYDGLHIYRCKKGDKNLSKKEIKFKFISFNFPIISNKNTLFNEYVIKNKSLPDIKKDFNINYKSILFLLDYYSIKKRTMKISSKQISSKKYKTTCLSRYGVDNVSKLIKIKDKKNKDNSIEIVDKIEIYLKIQEIFISKNFDIDKNIDPKIKSNIRKLYNSYYHYWLNLSDEQKDYLIDKIYSQIETKVTDCLDKMNISYIKRFMVGRKYFDIKIKNLLIDVNGDRWHANPDIYKEDDKIDFLFKKVKAFNIWKNDINKKNIAESNGYRVLYIWENEIKNMEGNKLLEYLKNLIY